MVKIVKDIVRKKNPYAKKDVRDAHRIADKAEKKRFPKGYQAMKHIDNKLKKHEFAGENSLRGRIEVSKKIPKKFRKEVEYHEEVELKNRKRIRKKNA